MNTVIFKNGPLRWKTQANGVPKLQGVFTMLDREGFPVDMSYEIAKEQGWDVDWIEALADASVEEIRLLEPAKVDSVMKLFAGGLMSCEGATFCDKAEHLYRQMWGQ